MAMATRLATAMATPATPLKPSVVRVPNRTSVPTCWSAKAAAARPVQLVSSGARVQVMRATWTWSAPWQTTVTRFAHYLRMIRACASTGYRCRSTALVTMVAASPRVCRVPIADGWSARLAISLVSDFVRGQASLGLRGTHACRPTRRLVGRLLRLALNGYAQDIQREVGVGNVANRCVNRD
jgi:hypothetical protein